MTPTTQRPPGAAPRWSRRRFLAALGAGGAAWAAGCARRETGSGALQLWLIWPNKPGTPPGDLVARLRHALPGVAVEVNSIWTNNLKEKLLDAAQHRALPDVFMLNSAWVDGIGGRDALLDLAPFAARDLLDLEQLVVPHDLDRCRATGRLLCLPAVSARGTAMLFTNRQLLEKLGLPPPAAPFANWAELREASRDYVRRANTGGTLEYLSLDPFSGPGLPLHTTLGFGHDAPPLSPDGRRSLLDSEGSLVVAEELDRYVAEVYAPFGGYRGLLHFRHRFAGQHRQPSYYSAPYRRQIFSTAAAGTIAVLREQNVRPEQIGVQPVPGLRGPIGGVRSHWWAYGISPYTARPAEAWRVVRYLTLDRDGGGRFCLDYGRPAALRDVTDADYRAAIGPAWDGMKQAIDLDRTYAASPGEDFLRPLLYAVPMRRLQGESIAQIFRDLHARFQAYLDHGPLAVRE